MAKLTEKGETLLSDLARRHEVSEDAIRTLLVAVDAGGGSMAQFSHPDFGGMGQWSRGGMVMVGNLFDHAMKAKVDAICTALSNALGEGLLKTDRAEQGTANAPHGRSSGWPAELGRIGSSGSQNDMRYAVFPETHRLAVEQDGKITIYDTADHTISGVSQAQSSDRTIAFSSQHGPVRLDDLKRV